MKSGEYLTKSEQYAAVYNKGSSWVNSLLVVKALPNGLALSRCGFSVSQRVGKAVTRNRVKRLLREIIRQVSLRPGWDIIFIARSPIAAANYAQIKESVKALLFQAQLLMRNDEKVYLKAN